MALIILNTTIIHKNHGLMKLVNKKVNTHPKKGNKTNINTKNISANATTKPKITGIFFS